MPEHSIRVAVTGVSGFIGSVLARQLAEAGYKVTGLVRQSSRCDHVEPYVDRFVVGDQGDESKWPDLLDGVDCVIHNSVDWSPFRSIASGEHDAERFHSHLQSNLVGSLRLLSAAARRSGSSARAGGAAGSSPRQFIFMSTIAVHHEMSPRWNGLIDEDHPLRPANWYGAYKAAVEAHLHAARKELGMSTCAIRPCGVYGIDPNLARSHGHALIEKIRRGEAIAKPGGGKFVHVEDVAAATVAAIGNPEADGRVFNLVDCYARWADWATYACELLGASVDIDMSSPEKPQNHFTTDFVQTHLGVSLDRGHDGIREHLRQLIQAIE